jgi:RecJ-like exonuclease
MMCPECKGTGRQKERQYRCEDCDGTGRVLCLECGAVKEDCQCNETENQNLEEHE